MSVTVWTPTYEPEMSPVEPGFPTLIEDQYVNLRDYQRLETALKTIAKWHHDHDLDCAEGIASDRCVPCIVRLALEGEGT